MPLADHELITHFFINIFQDCVQPFGHEIHYTRVRLRGINAHSVSPPASSPHPATQCLTPSQLTPTQPPSVSPPASYIAGTNRCIRFGEQGHVAFVVCPELLVRKSVVSESNWRPFGLWVNIVTTVSR